MRMGWTFGLAALVGLLLGCDGGGGGSPAPPAVDITGTWDIEYEWDGWWSHFAPTDIYMEEDGTFGEADVTGRVSGYNLSMTIVESDRTIWINAVLNEAGTATTSGTWRDSDGFSGKVRATKL